MKTFLEKYLLRSAFSPCQETEDKVDFIFNTQNNFKEYFLFIIYPHVSTAPTGPDLDQIATEHYENIFIKKIAAIRAIRPCQEPSEDVILLLLVLERKQFFKISFEAFTGMGIPDFSRRLWFQNI
tara:strand:+ start:149 stop:523 length:375 start_codon:yes stop_codon:yes gene_type:complete